MMTTPIDIVMRLVEIDPSRLYTVRESTPCEDSDPPPTSMAAEYQLTITPGLNHPEPQKFDGKSPAACLIAACLAWPPIKSHPATPSCNTPTHHTKTQN